MNNENASLCAPCSCEDTCATRVPIFQGLAPRELARFNDILVTRDYPDGSILYSQGSPARTLYIVNTGRVKIYKTSPDGREQVIRVLHQGEFFGEAVLFGEQTLAASAEALGSSRICHLDKSQAEEVIHRNPEIAHKLIAALSVRLLQAEEQIEYLGTRTTLQRVANLILTLSREQGKAEITLPLSREGLASLTGMTTENFSRKLSEIQHNGFIQPKGRRKIVILDESGLLGLT